MRNAGIDVAVVWRGVPSSVDSHAFVWEAPDGSTVRAEYLPENGYSNAAYIFGDDTLDAAVERLRPWFGDEPILGMVGTDHMHVVPDLPGRIAGKAEVATLPEYIAKSECERTSNATLQQTVTRISGELRSAARANLLPNVVSARIDLKQACAAAERALERYAEPLQALYCDDWPEEFLAIAWSRLLENAAHDSICGCSADEVSAQVLGRYAEAREIGEELTRRALERIGARAPAGTTAVVNPSPFERTEVVDVAGEPALVKVPPLGYTTSRAELENVELLDADVRSFMRIVRGRDVGDSYNYAPPEDDLLVDEPEDEAVELVEEGPLRRIVELHRTYRWDDRVVATTTRFEARAAEPFVRIRISFDNRCDDQRVRVHLPLPEEARSTRAEGQFAIVERPPMQEAGYGELGLGAYPASSFVVAGGVALLFEHVTEYELVAPRELAITVLRSVGLISRAANPWRTVNAGPELPIPAAQMHGPRSFSFAWCPDPERALELAERYRHPLLTTPGTGPADTRPEHGGPALEGAGAMLSSLRRRGDELEARFVNETDAPSRARFGDVEFELRPWEIRMIRRARD